MPLIRSFQFVLAVLRLPYTHSTISETSFTLVLSSSQKGVRVTLSPANRNSAELDTRGRMPPADRKSFRFLLPGR